MSIKNEEEKLEDAMAYYKNVRECLTGLFDLINVSFAEKDIFHQVGMDNLTNLHDNVLEVLRSSFTLRKVRIQLREIEFDEKETEQVFPL